MKKNSNCLRGFMMCLLGVFTLSSQLAFPQTASVQTTANMIGSLPGHNTPVPVMNGAAKMISHLNSNQMLRLVIGLQPANMAEQEQFLQDLQDRGSPQFHHFLTADEWNARFAPSAQDEQAVVDWAQSQGLTVSQRYGNRLIVDIEAPAVAVEKAFGVTLNNYQIGANAFFSNDRDPVIPSHLAKVAVDVEGLNNLQQLHPMSKNVTEPAFASYAPGPVSGSTISGRGAGDSSKLPASLRAGAGLTPSSTGGAYDPTDLYSSQAYNFNALYNQGHCCNPTNNPGGTPPNTSIAVATAGAQNPNDFQGFHNQYPYLAWHWFMISVDGTTVPCNSGCDGEGTLDFEWITAMSNSFGSEANTASVFMYDGVNANFSTFTDVYNKILSDGNARIFSTSWGCAEAPYCYTTGVMNTVHNIFNAMVGQGWTLVAATGDQGATASCLSHDGVQYPASDPDVVGAGGTTLHLSSGPVYSSETAWSGGPDGCGSNDGGGTGGNSTFFSAPSYQSGLGFSNRAVPDLALNADWFHTPQNYFFNGHLSGNGGTSIVAPELAGFFAQEQAYLVYLTTIIGPNSCYGSGTSPCVPMGNANYFLYYFGLNPHYASHYPYYDITSGCNDNDVTSFYNLGYFCAAPGYDKVTGWGSINALQLAWAINTYIAGDFGAPLIKFTGPSTGKWYNTNQTVSWTISGTTTDAEKPNGIAGYSGGWDSAPSDVFSEGTPGSGNSFYAGPQFPNQTTGSLTLSAAGQGCHTAVIEAWDNAGFPSGAKTYGQLCYDVTAPVTTVTLNGTLAGGQYDGAVQVTLNRSDSLSGIAITYYQVDGGALNTYTAPFMVSALGAHTISFHSVDNAGNVESPQTASFTIRTVGSGALYFVPVTPCRVADTRNPAGPFGGPELIAGSTRNFVVSSSACGIPSSAAAYSLNITVVPDAQLGYLTVWPSGQPQPFVSTLNSDGRFKANAAIVPAGAGGAVSIYASDATHVIIDIDGYFVEAGSSGSGLAFYKTTPCRLVDTRSAPSSLGGPFLSGGASRQFPLLSGSCGIPGSAAAYALNFTAVPHGSLTYLTTWPSGQPQPLVSTLNAPTGTVTANAAIVPAGSGGNISVFVSDDTDLVIDINGYFAPPASGGLSLYPLTPCRAVDTRNSTGQFTGVLAVDVAGSGCNVPGTAQAYILNATVVPPAPLVYLTLWANGASQPWVSTLNALDGAITSNMAIVPTTNGFINAYASDPTQLILDISSYFAP